MSSGVNNLPLLPRFRLSGEKPKHEPTRLLQSLNKSSERKTDEPLRPSPSRLQPSELKLKTLKTSINTNSKSYGNNPARTGPITIEGREFIIPLLPRFRINGKEPEFEPTNLQKLMKESLASENRGTETKNLLKNSLASAKKENEPKKLEPLLPVYQDSSQLLPENQASTPTWGEVTPVASGATDNIEQVESNAGEIPDDW